MNQDQKKLAENPDAVVGEDIPLRVYEDNPDGNSEDLNAAISAVPVKDYAHYEVEVEAKESYEGALFADESELDQALNISEPAAKPTKKAPPANYQDNAAADKGASDAISSVPVKDYANYEVEVEEKTEFKDALYADESAIEFSDNAADSNTDAEKTPSQAQQAVAAEAEAETEQAPPQAIEIDFDVFLPKGNQATKAYLPELGLNNSTKRELKDLPTVTDAPFIDLAALEPDPEPEPEAPPKNLAEKIKRKALAEITKRRSQADEYLGLSLPERDLPLEFIVTSQKPKKDIPNPVTEQDIKKFLANKGLKPAGIARQADKDLSQVARYKLADKERLGMLKLYTPSVIETARALVRSYHRKPALPDDNQRAKLSEHTANNLKWLISGYKQIYKGLYEAQPVVYGPQRNTANQLAFLVLDLLTLEQALLGATQRPVPQGSIKAFNKLFHALCHCEPWAIEQPQTSRALAAESSIKELFIRYQIKLAVDYMAMPADMHPALDEYLERQLGAVKLLPFNSNITLPGPTWMVTHEHASKASLVDQTNTDNWAPVYLLANGFFEAVKQDYTKVLAHLDQPENNKLPESLASLSAIQAAKLLAELNRSVGFIEERSQLESYTRFEPIKVKAYGGLATAAAWQTYNFVRQSMDPKQRAAHDAELPEKPPAGTSDFHCSMDDSQRMYLQTSEHKGTAAMLAGDLLMLVDQETEVEAPLLTRITRIERAQSGKLELIVEKLGEAFCPAKFEDDSDGLLVVKGDERLLLCKQNAVLEPGKTIGLTLPNKQKVSVKINQLHSLDPAMQVYTVVS